MRKISPPKGRPTKLDKKLADRIIKLLRDGNPISVVCDLVGISTVTYHNWYNKGEAANPNDLDQRLFFDFFNRCKSARADSEEKALRIVLNAAKGGQKVTKTTTKRKYLVEKHPDPDWGAGNEGERPLIEVSRVLLEEEVTSTEETLLPDVSSARWFLERRNRKEYGRTLGLTGADGEGPVQVETSGRRLLEHVDDEQLEALEKIVESAGNRAAQSGGDQG